MTLTHAWRYRRAIMSIYDNLMRDDDRALKSAGLALADKRNLQYQMLWDESQQYSSSK